MRRASTSSTEDIRDVFGDVALQASLTAKHALLEVYKVVGSGHTVKLWKPDREATNKPKLSVFRPYYGTRTITNSGPHSDPSPQPRAKPFALT